jgi:hypothetical protein
MVQGLAVVWMFVEDIGRATGFCRDILGLEEEFEEKQGSQRFRHPARFDYSENLSLISPILQELGRQAPYGQGRI